MNENYLKLQKIEKQIDKLINERNKICKTIFKEAKLKNIIHNKAIFGNGYGEAGYDNICVHSSMTYEDEYFEGGVVMKFYHPMFHEYRLEMTEKGEFMVRKC